MESMEMTMWSWVVELELEGGVVWVVVRFVMVLEVLLVVVEV